MARAGRMVRSAVRSVSHTMPLTIDRTKKGLSQALKMSVSPPDLENSPNPVSKAIANEPSVDGDQNLLKKMAEIEFLPDLFALLQRVENGEIKSQDFDNHAGSIRLKLNTLRSYLQEVDGICETVEEREEKIRTLSDCNDRRVSFLNDFKNRVLADLDAM